VERASVAAQKSVASVQAQGEQLSGGVRAFLSEAKPPQMKDRISLPPPHGMRGLSRMQQGGIGTRGSHSRSRLIR